MDVAPSRTEVQQTNKALREWATGLRVWSRHVRDISAAERERARRSGAHPMASRALSAARRDPSVLVLPPLGTVSAAELAAVLRASHGLGEEESRRALARGMLLTGYPLEADRVASADAFEVIEHALRSPG
jgi:hypothetical protein